MLEPRSQEIRDALLAAAPPPSPELADRVMAAVPFGVPLGAAAGAVHYAGNWIMGIATGAVTAAVVVVSVLVYGTVAPRVEVYGAYADSVTAAQPPAGLPSPWSGSPGVHFIGTGDRGFDAGAIRLDNPGDRDETVDQVTVDIGARRYDLWGRGLKVPAHGSLILTQTGYVSINPVQPDFDTSESNGGSCAVSDQVPVIHLTMNGQEFDIRDGRRVLNSGGRDIGSCPGQPSESAPWVHLGGAG